MDRTGAVLAARYELSVVERADACETPGEIGELLRREGLDSSHLSAWRKAVREGSLEALARRRGPKPSVDKGAAKKVARLEREVARLREELRKAHLVIEVQGKVSGLLGVSPGDDRAAAAPAQACPGVERGGAQRGL